MKKYSEIDHQVTNLIDAFKAYWNGYFDFTGVSSRSEY